MENQNKTNYEFSSANRDADPKTFWENVNIKALSDLHSVLQQQASNFLRSTMNIITLQGYELAMFRELETVIQNNSLTDEKLSDIMARISAFRASIANRAKEEQETREKLNGAMTQSKPN